MFGLNLPTHYQKCLDDLESTAYRDRVWLLYVGETYVDYAISEADAEKKIDTLLATKHHYDVSAYECNKANQESHRVY